MKAVHVKASREYDIIIGNNIELPKTSTPGRKLALISDDKVWAIYGKAAEAKLTDCGYRVVSYTFPNGEASKNITELSRILEFLAAENLTRTDMIAALGGGVTGDMAGFAAAVYLRGIEFIQLPTTLLAAVDSSVGGKTAIDLEAGKNLAGAFWQPSGVYCDCHTFKTLAPEIWADGMAEAIKYGMILDRELFEKFEKGFSEEEYPDMIAACVGIKRDVVEEDEKDTASEFRAHPGPRRRKMLQLQSISRPRRCHRHDTGRRAGGENRLCRGELQQTSGSPAIKKSFAGIYGYSHGGIGKGGSGGQETKGKQAHTDTAKENR